MKPHFRVPRNWCGVKPVVIIGAGPAGIAAAIQLQRYGIEPLLLEKGEVGGLLRNVNLVENYPGFPSGIAGAELVGLFKRQLANTGVKVSFEEVLTLSYEEGSFHIKTNKRERRARIVLVASGTKPKTLRLPSLRHPKENIKRYIFYEVHPLLALRNKRITIVGSGDVAFDYALNLSKRNKVIIFNRGKQVRCLPLLWERARLIKRISYYEDTKIKRIEPSAGGLLLTLGNNKKESLWTHYLVVAIGREPNLDSLRPSLKMNLHQMQKRKALYLIGDVKNKLYRQTALAVGDGEEIEKWNRLSPSE